MSCKQPDCELLGNYSLYLRHLRFLQRCWWTSQFSGVWRVSIESSCLLFRRAGCSQVLSSPTSQKSAYGFTKVDRLKVLEKKMTAVVCETRKNNHQRAAGTKQKMLIVSASSTHCQHCTLKGYSSKYGLESKSFRRINFEIWNRLQPALLALFWQTLKVRKRNYLWKFISWLQEPNFRNVM